MLRFKKKKENNLNYTKIQSFTACVTQSSFYDHQHYHHHHYDAKMSNSLNIIQAKSDFFFDFIVEVIKILNFKNCVIFRI